MMFIARKREGTLWAQGLNTTVGQIGRETDWVAVEALEYEALAMSADGSLWMWPRLRAFEWSGSVDSYRQWPSVNPTAFDRLKEAWAALLAPSRKPIKIANVFE